MRIMLRVSLLLLVWLVAVLASPLAKADTLKITSNPSGATVEIDGVLVGTTPYAVKLPGGYFRGKHTVFGHLLGHPMHVRIRLKGYITKELELTYGPMHWQNLAGTIDQEYYVLKAKQFHFDLEKISESSKPAALEQGIGVVSVISDPPGAEIDVDGQFVGDTPSDLHLSAGPHKIQIRASGEKIWERTLDVLKDSQISLHATLEPER